MKIIQRVKENKFFFFTFGMLMLVSFEFFFCKEPIHYIDNYYYPLYVINYDCGYCSRLLVGAVLSLFFGDKLMSASFIINLLVSVYLVVCFLISLFLNNYLKKTKFEALGIYAIFIVITPIMLGFLRFLGTLDLFWMGFVLGSLWLVDKKGWRWLVPVFCVVSLCIYELFVTTYLPVMAIAVFYQFVKKPNVSNFIYITVCAVFVGAATIYFLILGDSTMKMASDQMVEFARSKLDATGSDFNDGYLRATFFWEMPNVESYSGFTGYIQYNFDVFTKNDLSAIKTNIFFFICNLISAIPFLWIIAKSFRKVKKPLEKFVFFCCFSTVAFMFINLLLSTDTERFSIHFLLASLLLVLFFVKEKNTAFSESYDEIMQKIDNNKSGFAISAVCLARIVLSGVRF